jgi:hypothetical protein
MVTIHGSKATGPFHFSMIYPGGPFCHQKPRSWILILTTEVFKKLLILADQMKVFLVHIRELLNQQTLNH